MNKNSEMDLAKPNSHLHEPLFKGLSWTARDFEILGSYLSEKLISYIEDGEGPIRKDCMDRLCEMSDECFKIFLKSAYYEEQQKRLKLRKQLRINQKTVFDVSYTSCMNEKP